MDNQRLVDATIQALSAVKNGRFFLNERGYQGEFHSCLRNLLIEQGFIDESQILETENQKSERHNTHQRPDIILHIPREVSGADVTENNYAVWALKLRASKEKAKEDFDKLDEMFSKLHYPIGFFINIDSESHHFNNYDGGNADRLVTFSVRLIDANVSIKMAYWENDDIKEIQI
jgi:hypothetical protein